MGSDRLVKVHFNGWLRKAVKAYPKEAAGFLYSLRPYTPDEEWVVFPVRNVDPHPLEAWKPNLKELKIIRRIARDRTLVHIGNVHTHPLPPDADEDVVREALFPSDMDLKFAKRFGNIVRGIYVVDRERIVGYRFHDPYGNEIPVEIEDANA